MEDNYDDLAARVDDIEKTIGDIAEVLGSLKSALGRIPQPPNCPPYCGHEVEKEYEDKLSMEERVADMRKCIGDTGIVFGSLIEALSQMPPPNCPPYCSHETMKGK